jgi:hypothetical protein
MKKSMKRKIAKEVITFFTSVFLVALIYTILGVVNFDREKNVSRLKQKIVLLNHEIDSIKLQFPRAKTISQIFSNDSAFYDLEQDKRNQYVPTEALITLGEPETSNIQYIYSFLSYCGFNFFYSNQINTIKPAHNAGSIDAPQFVIFTFFMDSVAKELSANSVNLDDLSKRAQYLKRMYDFLVAKRKIIVGFPEFFSVLKGIPPTPSSAMWSAFQYKEKEKSDLQIKLLNTSSKILSQRELNNKIFWISLIILIMIYPLRFVFLLLEWSFKTLKQKDEIN